MWVTPTFCVFRGGFGAGWAIGGKPLAVWSWSMDNPTKVELTSDADLKSVLPTGLQDFSTMMPTMPTTPSAKTTFPLQAAGRTENAPQDSAVEKAPAAPAATIAESEAPAKPKPAAAAEPAVTPVSDDLKKINGIGPKLESTLNDMGVTSYAQIAKWSAAEIADVNAQLMFAGRVERENWVEQARDLHAEKYGKPVS